MIFIIGGLSENDSFFPVPNWFTKRFEALHCFQTCSKSASLFLFRVTHIFSLWNSHHTYCLLNGCSSLNTLVGQRNKVSTFSFYCKTPVVTLNSISLTGGQSPQYMLTFFSSNCSFYLFLVYISSLGFVRWSRVHVWTSSHIRTLLQ